MELIRHSSPNFNDRRDGKTPTILVLHYTGMTSGQAALERLCDKESQVSAHYLIEEDGRIFQMVEEDKRAWHAGLGAWRGERDINSASIGIEIVNPGHEFGYRPFPEDQMQAVLVLSADIVGRHDISPLNVIGHSDLAPDRKQDPGELFDWKRLAENGVGLWVEAGNATPPDEAGYWQALHEIGYGEEASPAFITAAFQRHWRPDGVTGQADIETRALAAALQNEVRRLT